MKIPEITRAVGNAVIVDPLTAGSGRDPADPQDRRSDGQIGATVTITCLTSICFVLVAVFCRERSENEFAFIAFLVIILVIVLIAIFAILWISVVAHRNTDTWYRYDTREQKDGLKIAITFLWVFGMASVVGEALEMTTNISCLDFNHKINTTGYKVRWYLICSNLTTILFCCIQITFVSYFIHYNFGNYISINYGFLITLMTNAVLWFISEEKKIAEYYEKDSNTHVNRSQDPCFWGSNITRYVASNLNPYLSPANIEFFLLSSGLILGMMPKRSESNAPQEDDRWSSDEMVPILHSSERRTSADRIHQHLHPVTYLSFIIVVIIVNLTLITGNVIFVFVQPEMFSTWISIDTCYKVIMTIVIMLIYYHIHIMGNIEPGNYYLKPGQYILLISTTGTVAVCMFGMIGGIQILPTLAGTIYIAGNCLDIYVAFSQTTLLIHLERVNRLQFKGNHIPTEILCFFMASCNISYWIIDSFVDARYAESKYIKGPIFENWDHLQKLLAPLLIFYRFHTFLDWYILYCKFKRMHTFY